MGIPKMTVRCLFGVLAFLTACASGTPGFPDPGASLDIGADSGDSDETAGVDPEPADIARDSGLSDAAVLDETGSDDALGVDETGLSDVLGLDVPSDTGAEGPANPVPGACVTAPDKAPEPTGPLPEPPQPARGIDGWERPAYEKLREAELANPYVHFVATWDASEQVYRVDSGDAANRKTLKYRRVSGDTGGVTWQIVEGKVADIFPSLDPGLYVTYADLLNAYKNPNSVTLLGLDYALDDPRVGFIPESALSYPDALLRIAVLFDAPHAPDVVAEPWPWARAGGGATHGSLGLLQSRSTLMLSGRGVRSGVVLDEEARLVDVAPTVLASLGAPTTGGIGPDGTYSDGLYLVRQDGRVLWEALTPEPCDSPEHVVVILLDGLLATEFAHQVLDADAEVALPTLKSLAQAGVVYAKGAVSNFPSVSAPGHMTSGTGVWSGHHGIIANAFFRRDTQELLNPWALLEDPKSTLAHPEKIVALYEKAVAPGIETLARAAHRAFGTWDPSTGKGAFVAVINEGTFVGSDFNTLDYLTGGGRGLEEYEFADGLAVTQVDVLLGDVSKPVPTILEMSFLMTDASGHIGGPHSALLRKTLIDLDAKVKGVLDDYASRDALDSTLIIVISDHGMELQDPSRFANVGAIASSAGVKAYRPDEGLFYLRTLEIEALPDAGKMQVTVRNHDNDAPVEWATVACSGCAEASAKTDASGAVVFTATEAAGPVVLTATHPEFNPQSLAVSP